MKRSMSIFRLLVTAVLALAIAAPGLEAQEPKEGSELAQTLIVKVTGKKDRVNGEQKFGAGIIFSVRGGYMFIATAFHVVGGSNGTVDVEFEFLRKVPVEATLVNSSDKLDLAVLQVDIQNSRLRGIPLDSIPFELLKPDISLDRHDKVYPIGHPSGEEWYVPLSPGQVRKVIFESNIQFEFDCTIGYSGGGLFNAEWNLAGLILKDRERYCEALSFKHIHAILKDEWGLKISNTRIPLPVVTPSATDQKVQALLHKADAYFARQWYTTPKESNAFDIYLEVLTLDPTNEYVEQQLQKIADFYRSRAEREVELERPAKAIEFYQTYLRIVPLDEEILDRIARLEKHTPSPVGTPTLQPAAAPVAGQEYHDPLSGIDFVWIPRGCFQMGQSEKEKRFLQERYSEEAYNTYFNDEHPYQVCLDGYWMGRTEVTQAQWKNVMGENPSKFQDDTRPVEQVSWDDTQTFLERLNAQAGQEIYRLPSEAEWEYAARAGTQTIYSFGDDSAKLSEYAWYGENSDNQTHPAGQLKPNGWGLYDMHGNVWEWCQDWYDSDYYSNSPDDNPKGPLSGEKRVLRGGSWNNLPVNCRSADRGWGSPAARNSSSGLGFRVVVVGVVAWTLP